MQFAEAQRYLLSLGHETLAIKLGLTNITLLLEHLGNPHKKFPSVQIAGTNGKGSTAAMLESICCATGIKTGLFTSPHLVSVTERIRIGSNDISEELFARCATEVRSAVEELLTSSAAHGEEGSPGSAAPTFTAAPTFFEQVTAIALLAFAECDVELAILETGLGGRLDATTAAGAEIVGITPIAVDHQEHLGESIESIASEKAAIIRPGVKAVVSPQTPEVMRVILDRSKQVGVHAHVDDCEWVIQDFTERGQAIATFKTTEVNYPRIRLGLAGRHQLQNAALALRLAEVLRAEGFKIERDDIICGLETAKHPGRLEFIDTSPKVLLDGAHNASGAAALREYLDEFVRVPITMIFGAMRDKQLHEMAKSLFPAATRLVLTQPENPRAAQIETLQEIAAEFIPIDATYLAPSSADALKVAVDKTQPDELICVAGSLYLIGEMRRQINEKVRRI
jgi:dihydrofolate synthase/folylpolyglutamate synthase